MRLYFAHVTIMHQVTGLVLATESHGLAAQAAVNLRRCSNQSTGLHGFQRLHGWTSWHLIWIPKSHWQNGCFIHERRSVTNEAARMSYLWKSTIKNGLLSEEHAKSREKVGSAPCCSVFHHSVPTTMPLSQWRYCQKNCWHKGNVQTGSICV